MWLFACSCRRSEDTGSVGTTGSEHAKDAPGLATCDVHGFPCPASDPYTRAAMAKLQGVVPAPMVATSCKAAGPYSLRWLSSQHGASLLAEGFLSVEGRKHLVRHMVSVVGQSVPRIVSTLPMILCAQDASWCLLAHGTIHACLPTLVTALNLAKPFCCQHECAD